MRSREKIGRCGVLAMLLAMTVAVAVPVFAGNPTPTGPPSSPGSRFTLGDLYLQLTTGANPGPHTGPFMEPAVGPPTSPVFTLDQILQVAPALDNANGAPPSQVLFGKKFWGLQAGGGWGPQTGSMSDNGAVTMTPTTADQAILAGYHNGSGKVVGDAALLAGNIKTGVSIFGVAGSVIGSTGTAVVGNVLAGSTFSNATTAGLTGTMPVQTLSASSTTVAAGYYAATTLDAVDTDLAAGNIKNGVSVFGITGTLTQAGALPGKTGQTTSFATGDDGDLKKGIAWPSPRFTDNGDGTVTDNLTKLIWLKNAGCTVFFSGDATGVNNRSWASALTAASSLVSTVPGTYCGLTDGSAAGAWRLPNRFELESLLDLEYYSPALSNAAGTGHCVLGTDCAFTNVLLANYYWTSSTYANFTSYAWVVYLDDGSVNGDDKTYTVVYVWPVRGGQ